MGTNTSEKPRVNRNVLVIVLVGMAAYGAGLLWRWQMHGPPEEPRLTALRCSADNGYPLLREALKLFPPKPAAMAGVPVAYRPEPDSLGGLLGVPCCDDDPGLVAYLAQCEPVVERIREALAKPYCLLPKRMGKAGPLVVYARVPEFYGFMPLAGLLEARARDALVRTGDYGAAMGYTMDLLRLGLFLQNDGMGVLGTSLIEQGVWRIVPILDPFPQETLQMALNGCHALIRQAPPPGESIAFMLRAIPNGNGHAGGVMSAMTGSLFGKTTAAAAANSTLTPDAVAELVALPYPQFRQRMPHDAKLAEEGESPGAAGITVVVTAATHEEASVASGMAGAAVRDTLLAGLEIRVALALYHKGHGQYPETLDGVKDVAPAGAPVDPFSGKPFAYRLTGKDSFTLYSVGPDLVDDAGERGKDINFSLAALAAAS